MNMYNEFTFEGSLSAKQMEFFQTHGFIYFEKIDLQQTVSDIIHSTEQSKKYEHSKVKTASVNRSRFKRSQKRPVIIQRFSFDSQIDFISNFTEVADIEFIKLLVQECSCCTGSNKNENVIFDRCINNDGAGFIVWSGVLKATVPSYVRFIDSKKAI